MVSPYVSSVMSLVLTSVLNPRFVSVVIPVVSPLVNHLIIPMVTHAVCSLINHAVIPAVSFLTSSLFSPVARGEMHRWIRAPIACCIPDELTLQNNLEVPSLSDREEEPETNPAKHDDDVSEETGQQNDGTGSSVHSDVIKHDRQTQPDHRQQKHRRQNVLRVTVTTRCHVHRVIVVMETHRRGNAAFEEALPGATVVGVTVVEDDER